MYYIGVDLGTSAVKLLLMEESGKICNIVSKEYPLYFPHPGWAEQKPEDWRDAALETITKVVKDSGVAADDIKGLGISGQMHGLVMLDEQGEVIRPSIIWCDQRTEKECEEMTEKVGAEKLIEITANPAMTGFTASKILWVRNNEPENYAKCKHILLPKDYVRYILTGEFATEVSDASGMLLLDVKNRCWSREMMEICDVREEQLPKLFESYEVVGTLKEDIAEELTQETFFQAVQCIDRFKGNSSILTWLCGIAKNVWLKDLRKRQEILSTNDHIQEIADEKEVNVQWEQKEILQLIHNMNEPIREVMYLRLVSNLSFAEIGEIIGKTENWTRVTFFRGKQKIVKEILKDE